MANRINLLQVRLTDGELKMVEALCEREGGIPKADVVRRCIEYKFKKEFPVYITERKGTVSPLKVVLTNEQRCERVGGEVGVDSFGTDVCRIESLDKSFGRNIPIDQPEMFEKAAKAMGLIQ